MTYRLSDVYTAIADPHRREILDLVSNQQLNVGEIAGHFDMSRTAVDKHLRVLIETNLIVVKKVGRTRMHELNPTPMKVVWDWMTPYSAFWNDRLQRLKNAVENTERNDS